MRYMDILSQNIFVANLLQAVPQNEPQPYLSLPPTFVPQFDCGTLSK
jgi:hypothetical protein